MKLPTASCGVSKRNYAVAKPAFALTSFGAVHLAIHPCSKLQGIQAKANKGFSGGLSCIQEYLFCAFQKPKLKSRSSVIWQKTMA